RPRSLLSGGRPVNADHIVVSTGSKQSLFNVCFTLFGPGDVVAIPAPAWVSYPQIVHLARGRPVLLAGAPEWSLKVSVRDLERMLPAPKGLILCSPSNPTGAVYTHAEIKAIAEWAAAALGDERLEQDVTRMVAEFRKRRDLLVARFRQALPGVEFVEPLGAFYFFFRVDSFGGITGTDFCTKLITQTGVALVPGAAFGDDRWVRLSYAAATSDLTRALDRIVEFAKKLGD